MSFENLTGRTLGQYELREVFGTGGMGTVYRAKHIHLKIERAIKVMSFDLANNQGYLERFNREAEIAAALEHPHIVSVIDFGIEAGLSYVVMRLLTGGTLSDRLRQRLQDEGTLPSLGEVAHLLTQIASALDYAHSQGVIHRDIKTSNIMFDNQGSAYILDFGIAKLTNATSGLTKTGIALGTPSHMAPELWRSKDVGAPADQYALGVVVYNVLTGRVPFEADTPAQLMYMHMEELPTPPHNLRGGIPEAVTVVLNRALAKQPQDRFPTVTAFAQAFAAAIAGAEGKATGFFTFKLRPQKRLTGSGSSARQPLPISGSQPIKHKNPRRNLIYGIIGVIAVLLLLLLVVIFGSGGRSDPSVAEEASASPVGIILLPDFTETPTHTVTSTDEPTVTLIPSDTLTSTTTASPTVTIALSPTSTETPTTDVVAVAQTLAAQQTAEAFIEQATVTARAVVNATETATLWTPTLTITATSTATPTSTITATPIPTTTLTRTATPTAIITDTPGPLSADSLTVIAQNSATAISTGIRAVYRIDQEESEVRFILDEMLRGQPNTVIGKTNQVAGDILINTANPANSQLGTIRINARTLATDNNFRNSAIRSEILESSRSEYEFIDFVPTALTGLPEHVEIGQMITFQVIGDLTIRAITRSVVFDMMAILTSDIRLEGTGSAVVLRSDYNLTIPNVPGVSDVDEEVRLEIDFVALQVARAEVEVAFVPTPTATPTLTPMPTSAVIGPNVYIKYQDDFDEPSLSSDWVQRGQTPTVENGQLAFESGVEWGTAIVREGLKENEGVLIEFQYVSGHAEMLLINGDWESEDYHRWGFVNWGEGWQLISSYGKHGENLTWHQSAELEQGHWYYLLLQMGDGGTINAYLWDRDNLSTYQLGLSLTPPGSGWDDQTWAFILQGGNNVKILLESYTELLFPVNYLIPETLSIISPTNTPSNSNPIATFNQDISVRSGPSTLFNPPIGSFVAGATADILGVTPAGDWYKIRYYNGEGWVFGQLITVSGDTSRIPVDVGPPMLTLTPVSAPGAGSIAAGSFEYGGHVTNTASDRATNAMRGAGMNWMKIQIRYTAGMSPDVASADIQNAHSRGFKVLLAIPGVPGELAAGGQGYIGQYTSFLGGVAGYGPDAIEVWNEPNLDREWPTGQISGAAFADLLRQSYQAIKGANGGVMVISGAPAPTGAEGAFPGQVVNDDRFVRDMVNAGALQYVDCVGTHYNEGIVSPRQTSGDPRDNYYTRYFQTQLDTYWNIIGGQKPICFTELGFLSPEGFPPLPDFFAWAQSVSVAQQAAWLAEAAALSSQSGKVRLMIVWNVDFTQYGSDPQAGYAMIRPDGTCPACNALANAR